MRSSEAGAMTRIGRPDSHNMNVVKELGSEGIPADTLARPFAVSTH